MIDSASGVLTLPGDTLTVSSIDARLILCQYTVSSIDTSVTIRMEVTANGTDWVNADLADTVVTENRSDSFILRDTPSVAARLLLVSEVGGTNARVSVTFLLDVNNGN
jgi:hypothetical protein